MFTDLLRSFVRTQFKWERLGQWWFRWTAAPQVRLIVSAAAATRVQLNTPGWTWLISLQKCYLLSGLMVIDLLDSCLLNFISLSPSPYFLSFSTPPPRWVSFKGNCNNLSKRIAQYIKGWLIEVKLIFCGQPVWFYCAICALFRCLNIFAVIK